LQVAGAGARKPLFSPKFEMHYFAVMTAEEVGAVVNRSAEAVRHDLRLARAWLRRELGGVRHTSGAEQVSTVRVC